LIVQDTVNAKMQPRDEQVVGPGIPTIARLDHAAYTKTQAIPVRIPAEVELFVAADLDVAVSAWPREFNEEHMSSPAHHVGHGQLHESRNRLPFRLTCRTMHSDLGSVVW
jgi:hypothetical protein